ncbi:MAG TPA: hypothetical protein DCR98_05670, partial [Cobetia sp.]|nr:hypothetical protein [Cobetia sp.]
MTRRMSFAIICAIQTGSPRSPDSRTGRMWFKNLQLYRLHDSAPLEEGRLADALPEHVFRPVTGVEAKRIGWVAP